MRAQAEALGLLADVVPSRWQLSRHKDEWFSLRVPTEALRQIRAALSLDAGKSAALVSSDGPRKLTREQVEEALKRGAASARGLDPKLRAVFSPPTDDLVLASVSPAEERRPASKVSDIADWQRRFRSAPAVWLVIDSDGIVTNAYDSAEGARLETTATRGRLRVQKMNIHDLRLATERWCNNFAPAEERRTPEQALTAEAMRRVPDRRERAADTRCPAHARLPGGEVIRCVRTDGHSTEHYYPTEEASWCWQGNSGDLAQIGPAPTRAEERREATTRGIAGDRCEPGNECGRLGCEECQR